MDDDAPSREFMCTLLSYRGHEIREASNGDSALSLIARQPPDAVITDVRMPGVDGIQLARSLRSEPATRHIPIVFSTAHYGPGEIQPLAEACDVQNVIFKPAHPTTVLATIDALLNPGPVGLPVADHLAETQRLTRSGSWQLDPDTHTIVVSPALRDLLCLRSSRLAPDELVRRVHPDDLAGLTSAAEDAWNDGSPGCAQVRIAGSDGTVRELIVSFRSEADGPRRLWGVVQDVTAIRENVRAGLRAQTDWHAVRRTIDSFHRAVLPQRLPAIAGADLATVYLPVPDRFDIGAAWYDVQPVPGGRILLSVGKVAGHELHPVAVTGQVLAALRAFAHDDPAPAGLLARLNRFLTATRHDDTFVTTVVALFDPGTGRLHVANAGNPRPLVVSADRDVHRTDDVPATLLAPAGPALGVLPEATFLEQELCLKPGEAFCAYTDALVERHHDLMSFDRAQLPRVADGAIRRIAREYPDRPAVAAFWPTTSWPTCWEASPPTTTSAWPFSRSPVDREHRAAHDPPVPSTWSTRLSRSATSKGLVTKNRAPPARIRRWTSTSIAALMATTGMVRVAGLVRSAARTCSPLRSGSSRSSSTRSGRHSSARSRPLRPSGAEPNTTPGRARSIRSISNVLRGLSSM
nr:SpoIIE family protein phosphatase [Virgisporangium ochraceum]